MSFMDMLQQVTGARRRMPPPGYPVAPDGAQFYQDDEDTFDPRGAAAGAPASVEPQVTPSAQGPASPFDPTPYQDRIHSTSQALQGKLDELGHMAYTPPQHGKGYRLAEGIVGMFSPQLSNALFERNEQRTLEGYHQNLETQGRQVSALQNAAQDAIREMGTAQTGEFYKQRGGYYDQLRKASEDKVETLQNQYADAVRKAISEHRDPSTDPLARQLQDAITGLQKQPAENAGETPYKDWRKMHPDADPIEWQRAQAQVRDEFKKDPQPKSMSHGQAINIEARKNGALAKAEARFKLGSIDQQELEAEKQRIQNAYESEINAGGGDSEHFEYPSPDGQSPAEPQVTAPGAPPAAPAAAAGAKLSLDEAKAYLQKAGGDKNRARQMALKDGRSF